MFEHNPKSKWCRRFTAFLFLLLSLPTIVHSQPRRLGPADILRVATVSDAQISPSGELIVYSVSAVEGDQNISPLWIVRVGERLSSAPPTSRQPEQRRNWERLTYSARPLLPSGWNGSNPRWSPDGKNIAFLATREGQRGIWITGPTRTVPRFVTAIRETNFFTPYAGESLAWAPDSRMIAYISANEEEPDKGDDPRVIDRVQYKSRISLS